MVGTNISIERELYNKLSDNAEEQKMKFSQYCVLLMRRGLAYSAILEIQEKETARKKLEEEIKQEIKV